MARGVGPDLSTHLFRDQTLVDHVMIVVVGALLGIVSYVYLAGLLGGSRAISVDGMAAVRRTAIALSGVVVGAYLSVAFVRGIGGPLLNLLYLLGHLTLTPLVAVRLAGQSMPADLFLPGRLLTGGNLLELLLVGVLPLSTYVLVQALWFRHRCSADERIEWADEQLPSRYHDTLLDPSRFDR